MNRILRACICILCKVARPGERFCAAVLLKQLEEGLVVNRVDVHLSVHGSDFLLVEAKLGLAHVVPDIVEVGNRDGAVADKATRPDQLKQVGILLRASRVCR